MTWARAQGILLLALAAALLAALGYWNIGPQSFSPKPTVTRPKNPRVIDFFAENVDSTQYLENGTIDSRLTAEHMEHEQASDLTLLRAPHLLIYRGAPPAWDVRSREARMLPGGEQIELIDEVRLEHAVVQPAQLLTSSRMTVFPKRNYAQTDQPVRISGPFGVITGVGMQTDLDTGKTVLLSNVRGQHELH